MNNTTNNTIELSCFCIDRQPKEKRWYNLELICNIENDGDITHSPKVTRRYVLSEAYDSHNEAMAEGEDLVCAFSKCGVQIVHDKLYTPEIVKTTVEAGG